MMMNTKQRILDEERLQDFVGDFNKHFEDLAKWYEKDAERMKNIRESFWERYLKIFNDSFENEVEMETTMETESRPIIDREEKLRKVEEKLLSNKAKERFTTCDGVMSDDGLTLLQKIIHLQKATEMQQEEKSTMLRYKDNCLKNAFFNLGKFIKKLWRKRRLQCSGRYFYESCINSFSTTVNFNFALFPYVFFALTSR